MNYNETLQWLFGHLPMYQRVGAAAYKKDLTNTLALCAALSNPQQQFVSIHIAGTNGKGSVSNMLASILQQAGYKVGLYTSPHLVDFRERIRVNGVMCSKEFVVDFTESMKQTMQHIQPSFFELTVAMAFEYFAKNAVDIAVIETGLGGRLDSTNIIEPILSVITNISYDHQAMLGNTLPQIAFEKAGIIKRNIPVVIGEYHAETFPVFTQKSEQQHAPLYLAEQNVAIEIIQKEFDSMQLNISYLNQLMYPNIYCDLTGNYQVKNIKTVIQSVEILRQHFEYLDDNAVYEGLNTVKKNTGFAGRWDVISTKPLIVCDCAHNSGGLQELFAQIKETTFITLRIVMGMVNDKDASACLQTYPENAVYYFCKPNIPRGLATDKLIIEAQKFNLKGREFLSVKDAIAEAKKDSKEEDMIVICGSIFVVAEALENDIIL